MDKIEIGEVEEYNETNIDKIENVTIEFSDIY